MLVCFLAFVVLCYFFEVFYLLIVKIALRIAKVAALKAFLLFTFQAWFLVSMPACCRVKSNLLLYSLYHRKRVTSLRGPSPRHYARETQLLSKKCGSGGEPLATLSNLTARDLNLRPPAPETNALPLDKLAGPSPKRRQVIAEKYKST